MMDKKLIVCLSLLMSSTLLYAQESIKKTQAERQASLLDASGQIFNLGKPVKRVVALAPHLVELVYAIGAGDKLVASVSYADYPEAAKKLPRVGSYRNFSIEAIVRYQPDLILAWHSSSHKGKVQQLQQMGYRVFWTEALKLNDITKLLNNLGVLLDAKDAPKVSQAFEHRYQSLQKKYSGQTPVSVFYQVWNRPLQTLSGKHLISDVIRLCGGRNVFADAQVLAPKVNIESVIRANPQVIVASGMGESRPEWLDDWHKWGQLQAVQRQQLYFVPPDIIQRHTTRILDGATLLCRHLLAARKNYQK